MNKILLILFSMLILIPAINAVEIIDFYWTNSQTDTIEIDYGQLAQFEAYVADGFSNFRVNVFLEENSTGNMIPIYNRSYNAREVAEITRAITTDYYFLPGAHTLHITAINDDQDRESQELNLIINQAPQNHAPEIELLNPANEAENVPLTTRLSWNGTDQDGDNLTYDIYINNQLVRSNIPLTSYFIEDLRQSTNYTWYVVASDGDLSTRSDIWNFTTIIPGQENRAPFVPSNPNPANGSENVQREELNLTWTGGDPDGDEVTYDVYLNNGLVCNNILFNRCILPFLRANTPYNWYVEASDGELTTRGPIWRFTTLGGSVENTNPIINITHPKENTTIIDNEYVIQWNAYDPDIGDSITNTKIYYDKKSLIERYILFWNDNYQLLASLDGNPGSYNWDVSNVKKGIYSMKIVVTDSHNKIGEDTVERFKILKITPGDNNAPRITSEPITTAALNKQYSYDVDAVDADGDAITYSLIRSPEGMTINSRTGLITWTPEELGDYIVVLKASDGVLADPQAFTINVVAEELIPSEEKEPRKIHEFNITNIITDYDNNFINVYVQISNAGNQNEKVELRAINMQTSDIIFDSFNIENNDNYWRILRLPRPNQGGIYTIGVWGNSKDYKDMLLREVVIQ